MTQHTDEPSVDRRGSSNKGYPMTPLERLKDDLSRRTDKYEHVVVACDDLAKLLAVAEALKPFTRASATDAVCGGGILTVSNGNKMFLLRADDFANASGAYTALTAKER